MAFVTLSRIGMAEAMKIEPLTTHIGAEIHNINLAQCSDAEFDEIYRAFLQYQVIFFRDQELTPTEHLQLAQRFGELEPVHPFFPNVAEAPQVSVIETTRGNAPLESFWHTDLSWQEAPSKCSVLHAKHTPCYGGDTIWVSMSAVLNALPADLVEKLKSVTAMHSLFAFDGIESNDIKQDWQKKVVSVSQQNPPVEHPVLMKHPETGEVSLYINEQFTRSLVGLSKNESRELLATLFNYARKPEYQVRFRWKPNSLAIWDNRITQHYAVIDYGDTPRRLHRVTIQGNKPQAAY